MRVSEIQMNPGADGAANIGQAEQLVGPAVSSNRQGSVSLLEIRTCLGGNKAVKQVQAEVVPPAGSNEPEGPEYEFPHSVARGSGLHMHRASIRGWAAARIEPAMTARVRRNMPLLEHQRVG